MNQRVGSLEGQKGDPGVDGEEGGEGLRCDVCIDQSSHSACVYCAPQTYTGKKEKKYL